MGTGEVGIKQTANRYALYLTLLIYNSFIKFYMNWRAFQNKSKTIVPRSKLKTGEKLLKVATNWIGFTVA